MFNFTNSLLTDKLFLNDCVLPKPSKGIYKPRKFTERQKAYFKWLYSDKKASKDDYNECSLYCISDEWFRTSFYNLCKDHEKSINYLKYSKYNDNFEVRFKYVYKWVYMIQEKYNFTYYDSYIRYNSNHFALWGKDLIIIADDFRNRNKETGHWMKYSDNIATALNVGHETIKRGDTKQGMTSKELVKRFARVFYFILTGNKAFTMESYLWHVMKFTIDNLIIEEGSISSKQIYDICVLEACSFTKHTPNVPIKYRKNGHHGIYYIEPGYTKEETVGKYLNDKCKQDLANAILYLKKHDKPLTEDNVLFAYKMVGGKQSHTKNGLGTMNKGTLVKHINEMKENTDFGSIVGDGLVRKQHKQQERSKWHLLIDLNKTAKANHEEIVKQFPEVKYESVKKKMLRMKLTK